MVVIPAILALLGLTAVTSLLVQLGRWPVLAVLLMLGLAFLYRFGPSRRAAKWRWISLGSIVATLLWLAASIGFSWYVTTYATYDQTYGSLGAVIILMLWLWVSAFVILVGGELNAELELQTVRDTTVGPDRPLGRRGAYVADNVAPGTG